MPRDPTTCTFEILSAGQIAHREEACSSVSECFLIIAQNMRTKKFTVWALPDLERGLARILELKRVISERDYNELFRSIYASELAKSAPNRNAFTFRGFAGALFAETILYNAEMVDVIARIAAAEAAAEQTATAN